MIKIKILDKDWKVFIYEADHFVSRFKDDTSAAFTLIEPQEVHFNEEELTLKVVRHEMFHCFYASLPINSMEMSLDNQEEVCAELYAEYGKIMDKLSRQLYKELKTSEEYD